MNKVIKPYSLEEKSTLDLLNAIYKQKRAIKCSKWNACTLVVLCVCIIPVIIFFFNILQIQIVLLYEFLQDLLNILSILVGFTITALSIIGTGLSKEIIQLLSNYESQQNINAHHSIYHTTILIFFEYIYSLLITLGFIVLCLFLYPYAHFINSFRLIFSILFFYTFILLAYWSVFSVKGLIFNLYCIIMLNSQVETQNNNRKSS